MKTLIKLSGKALLILLVTITNTLSASERDDTTVLIINGRVLCQSKKIKPHSKCKIFLYNENNVIDSMNMRFYHPFEFKLKKNVWYTIKITGEDLIPTMISFNTKIDDKTELLDIFYFDVEMLHKEEMVVINKDLVEFPIGQVEYDRTSGLFQARKAYSNYYKENLFLKLKDKTGESFVQNSN